MTTETESFNVLEQPWIPVRWPDGTVTELGMRDVLKQAHEIEEITHESVMIEYGLYRLLITFLMDALRPQSEGRLVKLIGRGSIDMGAVNDYIEACRNEGAKFDLFDAERPFLQAPLDAALEKSKGPVFNLDYAQPRGNNHVHFVHPKQQTTAVSYAEAARLLPALQIFSTIGGRGYASGINGAPPYYALIRGANLFETLLYSLPVQDAIHNLDFDKPSVLWRAGSERSTDAVTRTSLLAGMIFPVRRVHLFPENGQCSEVCVAPGLKFKADVKAPTWTDPHVAYSKNDKGRFAWVPQQNRGVWRNIAQLAYPENMPVIVNTFKRVADAEDFVHLQLYGVQTDQAAFLQSTRADVQLPVSLTDSMEAADAAVAMVRDAEIIAYRLQKSLEAKAASSAPIIGDGLRDACVQQFYDACGEEFWRVVGELAAVPPAEISKIRLRWMTWAASQAKTVRRQLLQSVSVGARELFALENAGNAMSAYLGGMVRKKREELKEKEGKNDEH